MEPWFDVQSISCNSITVLQSLGRVYLLNLMLSVGRGCKALLDQG
jgi:hypothetical protein